MIPARARESTAQRFTTEVDRWVTAAVKAGIHSFDKLLTALPGVYPVEVLESVHRLVAARLADPSLLARVRESAEQPRVARGVRRSRAPFLVPHPLDFDWRFAGSAVEHLLDIVSHVAGSSETVLLLGAPTLFAASVERDLTNRVVLLDKSASVIRSLESAPPKGSVIRCDLMVDSLPSLRGRVVVVDPPWYEEYLRSFLWASSTMCEVGGQVLLSVPPNGTRPGVREEVERLLIWSKSLGLELQRVESGVLPYLSPPFERNALRAAGIESVPEQWRRGSLAVFSKVAESTAPRPQQELAREDEWAEYTFDGVRVRVRGSPPSLVVFEDPSLISIVPNDVLPSVSRRDPRRLSVSIWTSRNRVFSCHGIGTLHHVFLALSSSRSPSEAIAFQLSRPLGAREVELVARASTKIRELVATEQAEALLH